MKKYDSYKDSGIEWIGEIPRHWEVKRGKEVLNFSNGYPFNSGLFSMDENEGFPLVRIRDLKSDKITTFYKGEIVHEAMIDNNDFIIGMDGDFNIVKWNKGKALLNQRLCKIEGVNHLETNYLSYSLPFYLKIINDLTYYTTVKHLSNNDLFEQKFLVPNSQEQITIANYLDQKTTQIDDLIAKKERLIQLLEEERTAIINQAVTKGLDPTVPMKDSGIEWLGEIPAHWEVKRIKYIGKIISGYSFKSEDFTQTGVRVMKISNIQTMRVDWTDDSYLPENFLTEYERFKINKGDLVFALTRPIISTGIKATIVNEQEKILLNQRNAVLKSGDKLNVRWMYYMIFNEKFKEHFESLIDGTGQQPNISSNDIANINIPLPELNEQNEIVQFLDSKMENVETIISKYQKEIELLKEYKTALISEVVTGKVDVREEKIN